MGIVAEMRSLLDTATAEKRDLTAEEQAKYDQLFSEQETTGNHISREERQHELDRQMAEAASRPIETPRRTESENRAINTSPRATPEYRAAFATFLRNGVGHLSHEEHRALQSGSDPQGSYRGEQSQRSGNRLPLFRKCFCAFWGARNNHFHEIALYSHKLRRQCVTRSRQIDSNFSAKADRTRSHSDYTSAEKCCFL